MVHALIPVTGVAVQKKLIHKSSTECGKNNEREVFWGDYQRKSNKRIPAKEIFIRKLSYLLHLILGGIFISYAGH